MTAAPALQTLCTAPVRPARHPSFTKRPAEGYMSKGMDQKKSEKKAPAKTLKEKRADKQEKKKGK